MKRLAWRRGSFLIKCAEQSKKVRKVVPAWSEDKVGFVLTGGVFGIHDNGAGLWTLTHIPSGYAIAHDMTETRAKELGKKFARSRWGWRAIEPNRVPVEAAAWARRAIEAVGGKNDEGRKA